MTVKTFSRCFRAFPWALALLFASSSLTFGQAWVPGKGQAFLSASYQRQVVERHLFSAPINGDSAVDLGDIDSNTAILGMDYGLTDRLALSGDVALVSARYKGAFAENPAMDDGAYHGTPQDMRLELRYRFGRGALAITPFAGAVIPTHNYERFGHAVAGGNLNQYIVGTNVGRIWARPLHTTYVQGRYSYSIFQKHEDHSLTRSNASLEGGTFLTPLFGIRAFGAWQRSFGGLDWFYDDLSSEVAFHAHDALANANFYSAGAGVFYRIGPTATLTATYARILYGQNTHDGGGFTIGTLWQIGGGEGPAPSEPGIESVPATEGRIPD